MSGLLRKAGLYWHTLRHLKPSQVWWQLRYRVSKPKMPADGPPPAERARVAADAWVPPAPRPKTLQEDWDFQYLNLRASWEAAVAEQDARELLWQYRFHEFEDLVAEGAAGDGTGIGAGAAPAEVDTRRALHEEWIARWIAAFPPLTKAAWDPYPISMRVGNWVRWALAGGALDDTARASMARQLRHLEKRLEFHLRANHLMENAKALYLGGSFLAGAEADRWRARGRALLREQVAEQILADGGHCERSPMYHSLMLEALQDCASCARVYGDDALAEELAPTLAAMDRWLRVLTHPDGGIAFFQDACHGVALPPADLHQRSAALCKVDDSPFPPALHLESSGYVRLHQDDAVLFMDAGAPGPPWQPGHAHAGALSIEFSLGAQRILVNTGTSCYGDSPERLRQRGTLAHNTVCLEGKNSSEVWSGFRVARRARVDAGSGRQAEDQVIRANATLDSYAGGALGLLREVALDAITGVLEVEDWLPFADGELSWHLHPSVEVGDAPVGNDGVELRVGARTLHLQMHWENAGGAGSPDDDNLTHAVEVQPADYAPRFGVVEPSKVLCFAMPRQPDRTVRVRTRISWK